MLLKQNQKQKETHFINEELSAGCAASLLLPDKHGWENSVKSKIWEIQYRGNEKQVKNLFMGCDTEKSPSPRAFLFLNQQ